MNPLVPESNSFTIQARDQFGNTTASCSGIFIINPGNCDDGNACTIDACIENICTHTDISFDVDAGSGHTLYLGYAPNECVELNALVTNNNASGYSYQWNTGATTAGITYCADTSNIGVQWVIVTVTDDNGCAISDTVQICVIDIRCSVANNGNANPGNGNGVGLGNNNSNAATAGVLICDNNGNTSKTICVKLNNVDKYLQRGSYLGRCDTDESEYCNPTLQRRGSMDDALTEMNTWSNALNIKAYPNPFSNEINIEYSLSENSDVKISLLGVNGQTLVLKQYHDVDGKTLQQEVINTENWSAGIYIVKVETNTTSQVMKMVLYR